jgi:hypothetical protein
MLSPLEMLAFEDKILLTTTDNPFNPFVDWDAWYAEDLRLGHDTCGRISRTYVDTDDMSDTDSAVEYARTIREIFSLDADNLYTLAIRLSFSTNVT